MDELDNIYYNARELLSSIWNNPKYGDYLPTGFYDLDKIIRGLRSEQLVVISSEPGNGKTTFAMQMLMNINRYLNQTAMLFSENPSKFYLPTKILSLISGKGEDKLAEATDDDYNELTKYFKAKLLVDNRSTTWEDIYRKSYQWEDTYHPRLICVDSLQHYNLLDKSQLKRDETELHRIVINLKKLSEELQMPIVLLSNNIHEGYSERYHPDSIAQCGDQGACLELADVFIKLSHIETKEIKDEREYTHHMEVVDIKKNRNGRCGKIYMNVDEATGKIHGELDEKYIKALIIDYGDIKESKLPF